MNLSTESWTPSAVAWIGTTGRARILHLFQDVCNLVNLEGDVLSLTAANVPRTAFSLRTNPSPTFAEMGGFRNVLDCDDSVVIAKRSLQIGQLTIAFGEPPVWDPVPGWEVIRGTDALAIGRRQLLKRALSSHAPAEGLSSLVGSRIRPRADAGSNLRVVRVAQVAAHRLLEGLRLNSVEETEAGALVLLGLGPGLTPSGDDFLVGCLHALWLSYPSDQARSIAASVKAWARGRTTTLSRAWIEAAARGEAAEHWHVLFDSLASGVPRRILSSAGKLLKVGHSSGADSLVGFLTTLDTLEAALPHAV